MNDSIVTHKSLSRTSYLLLARTVPAVGTHSTNYWYGQYQLLVRCLVLALFLLLLAPLTAWGQDYSGIFLIANNNDKAPLYNFNSPTTNFYMCPAEGYVFYLYENNKDKYTTTDTDMPFLTTYQCYNHSEDYDLSNALWEIQKIGNTNYYYIIHKESEKYLTFNGQITYGANKTANANRMRFHLETNASPGNAAQFTISKSNDGYFNISPINSSSYYLNPAKGNYDNLTAEPGNNNSYIGQQGAPSDISIYGIVGMFNNATDAGSKWYLETLEPVITYDSSNKKVVLSHIDESATIYYTTDGTDPTTTNYTGTGSEITNITSSVTIKAIAERSGIVSHISEIRIIPNATISFSSSPIVYNGSAQEPTVTVKDGETTIPASEYSIDYSNNKDAGTASVTITDNAGGNYIVYGSTTFTINPKPLTITAKPQTITYGDAPANDGVTYSEFAGEETESVLTGTLTYNYDYEQYGDAGSYTITPSGLSNSNYDISFVPGTLTVNPKAVIVTSGITASDKTYDGTTDATLDGSTAVIDGKINNDDLTVLAGSGTFADKNVGTDKTVTINSFTFGGAKAGNYQMAASGHQATAQASITPAALTVTAEAQSKTYGDDDPEFTYSSDGLISPDAISGDLSRAEGENVGTYAISLGTLTAGSNYNITFTSANLTISPKSLGDGNQPAEGIDIELTAEGNLNAVKDGSTTLEEDVDYTYTIETEGSDQLVTVTGIGNYTSSAKALYAKPVFTKPTGSNNAAAVYKASKDLANPSGITPYIVRKVNPSIGTITITPLQYIPEGVPVLLLSDEEASGFVASPKEEATPEITDGTRNSNKLLVSEGGETVEAAQIYMFYLGEFVLTKAGTLGTGKFYLYNPNYPATPSEGQGDPQSRTTLEFVIEEDATEINDVISKMEDIRDDWYTIDGRKLSGKPTKPGLYIKNGHKTIIKRK